MRRYLIKGLLEWGIPAGIAVALINALYIPGTYFEFYSFSLRKFLSYLLFCLPLCMALGAIAGITTYYFFRKT